MAQPCRRCGQVHGDLAGCALAQRPPRPTLVGEDEALVGNVVAERYHVGEVIGKGATGTVFGAVHVSFSRAATMKVLRPLYADADLVSRVFHGEARAAWSVSHPGLCEVFDIGTLPDGAPFFVMERLEGETLATRIRRDRMSIASAVDMVMQLLSVIAAIHARDLLLRDLRPQNLFLAHRRGCRPLLKILDFGLARLTPLDRIEQEWEVLRATVGAADAVGSTAIPYYLSPERTRGENGIEPASDLFVVGAILYEALAGVRPFDGPTLESVLHQIRQGRATPLIEHRPDVSADVSSFLARALAPNPRQRPASAKDMQDELRALFEGARKGSSASIHAIAIPPPPQTLPLPLPMLAPDTSMPPPRDTNAETQARRGDRDVTLQPRSPLRAPPMMIAPLEDLYEETQTKRGSLLEETVIPRLHDDTGGEELSTAARRIDPEALVPRVSTSLPRLHGDSYGDPGEDELATKAQRFGDETSADNTDRTVPPPPTHEIDVSFEDPIDRTVELHAETAVRSALAQHEDEETETMALTPELRARVDELMNLGPPRPPNAVLQPLPPPSPPTRGRRR